MEEASEAAGRAGRMAHLHEMIQSVIARMRIRRARLPWRALEEEAARQGCSPADIFFDWAGQRVADGDGQLNEEGSLERVASDPARRART